MAKASFNFQNSILNYLKEEALRTSSFKLKLENPKKNIEDCITYILNYVEKSGENGFDDSEIFGMALHYYHEDEIEIGNKINIKVVVNHKVDLTNDEILDIKEKARKKIYQEIKNKIIKTSKEIKTLKSSEAQKSLF